MIYIWRKFKIFVKRLQTPTKVYRSQKKQKNYY